MRLSAFPRSSAALLLCIGPALAQGGEGRPYDPLAGLDPNGRIPKIELPDDLPHKERWRYTPPGRIKPGNVLDRFLVSSFVTPLFFREEDIGFGGGIALTDVDFRNQGYREFANIVLSASAEGQQSYRFFWQRWLEHRELPNGGIVREERNRLFGRVGYEKTLTRRFFGLGSRTQETDETSYTEEITYVGGGVRWSLPDPSSDWLARVDVRGEHHGLSRGRVEAVPSTDDQFPELFLQGDSESLWWFDTSVAFDTRDSLSQPYRGGRLGAAMEAGWGTGGDLGAIVTLDGQFVVPVPPLLHGGGDDREENPPTDVLAIAGFVQDTLGDLPFYSLPTLGGTNTLRGYIQNRFTDRSAAHFSLEYRIGVVPRGIVFTDTIRIERIGLAVFYEGGTVADGIEEIADGRYLDSYGFGARIAFSREATFRVDVGYGDEGSNFTIAFGNSF